jgi:hypothetical protein
MDTAVIILDSRPFRARGCVREDNYPLCGFGHDLCDEVPPDIAQHDDAG